MSFLKKIKKAVQKIPQEARNFSNSVVRTGTAIGAAPFQVVGGVATQSIKAVAPALSAATSVMADNPALAGALGAFTGLPLGSFAGGVGAVADPGYAVAPAPERSGGMPIWGWIAIAGGGLLAVVFLLRKRA